MRAQTPWEKNSATPAAKQVSSSPSPSTSNWTTLNTFRLDVSTLRLLPVTSRASVDLANPTISSFSATASSFPAIVALLRRHVPPGGGIGLVAPVQQPAHAPPLEFFLG